MVQLPRRRLLIASALAGGGGLASVLANAQAPAVVTSDRQRPAFPSGVQSGDVLADRGIVWARSDRAGAHVGGVVDDARASRR